MPARKATKKKSGTRGSASKGFTKEEKAAMKERAAELKAEANKADGEKTLLAAVAKTPPKDRTMGKRLHKIVTDVAPDLMPKTWYGMPAWANEDGKVVVFFTPASKFKERYASLGFNTAANLDQGAMWPTGFALKKLGPAEEKKIRALVKKAVS